MKEKLKHQLRTFLIGMSFPILFSSGCSKIEDRAEAVSSIYKNVVDGDKLREDLFESFEQYFSSNNLEYTGLESLLTDEEIANVIEHSKTTSECDFVWDGDIENLKKTIKNNSVQFLEENSQFESAFCDATSDYDLWKNQLQFEGVFDDIIEDFLANSSNNINEDICKFQTLNIVFCNISGSDLGGYLHNSNTIVLFYPSILNYCVQEGSEFIDELTKTLRHELNHVRQVACEDRLNSGQQYAEFCYLEETSSFIVESSAESALYNINNTFRDDSNYAYISERDYESLFFLLAVFNENVNVNDYYNAIFDTDLESFYEFVGCKDEGDIFNFYKMLGSIDAALGRNINLDSNIETVGDAKGFIGYNYKINIFNSVLSNMVDYTCNHSDFSLEDNLTLFKIVKTVLSNGSFAFERKDIGELESIYDSEFVSSFKEREDMYYAFLGMYYQTDISEMEQIEENYADKVMNTMHNICDSDFPVSSYQDEATSLLGKFPLLEPIFKATHISSYMYDSFVDTNHLIYEKKK